VGRCRKSEQGRTAQPAVQGGAAQQRRAEQGGSTRDGGGGHQGGRDGGIGHEGGRDDVLEWLHGCFSGCIVTLMGWPAGPIVCF
jgi:hypothetical protein